MEVDWVIGHYRYEVDTSDKSNSFLCKRHRVRDKVEMISYREARQYRKATIHILGHLHFLIYQPLQIYPINICFKFACHLWPI
jgi:hypothetical protein